ncbi:MAG TPA: sigma-54 dependent transcriptional regulator [Polyangiaceae bacterium]|nr:sigma-54 dependent transcriptional regulator [Polyangiaceae bacterium]
MPTNASAGILMPEQARSVASKRGNSSARQATGSPRILVVDDEPDACEVVRQVLEGEGYSATAETSPYSALEKIATQAFDLVLTDIAMAEMNGLTLCREILDARPGMPVILVTGKGSISTVIAALRLGARDFLMKPLDAESLVSAVARSLRHLPLRAVVAAPSEEAAGPHSELTLTGMAGSCPGMREVYEVVRSLSDSLVSVVVDGETGTGKESIARALHANSKLRSGPFVALSCAAMPAGLLESELFGHLRGAFTDAKTTTKGLFVEANGGTLLLDEIGELPLELQPKLLRALQERKVRPLGGNEELPFDCRIVATTNRDLEVEVREKRFREDLYYRLNVVRITVPPLRERGDDVLLLAHYFLKRFAKSAGRDLTMAESAEKKLLAYFWPGNVRELENCIERAVTLARLDELTIDDLPDKIRIPDARYELPPKQGHDPDVLPLVEIERRHILRALKLLDGNKARAAELLGIDRSTLYRRLELYGVPIPRT